MIAFAGTITAVLGLNVVANETGANAVGFVVAAILLGFGLAPFVGILWSAIFRFRCGGGCHFLALLAVGGVSSDSMLCSRESDGTA